MDQRDMMQASMLGGIGILGAAIVGGLGSALWKARGMKEMTDRELASKAVSTAEHLQKLADAKIKSIEVMLENAQKYEDAKEGVAQIKEELGRRAAEEQKAIENAKAAEEAEAEAEAEAAGNCIDEAMLETAYLVGIIDTKLNPPALKGAGIFSEPGPTINGHPIVIAKATGEDYDAARDSLKSMMETPWLSWTKDLF